uniref:Uncharacterized protein n=1 Tax=Chromera velia CCMP2878 TaxID=1169474 RepID=A0A0G4HZ80_9ALVE|eukprot:Cvel_33824.t1-p1 / transcript=Cvel_33824.t1 / gene=Cvel_33824 / organism=Chromera_velia_CCMP2878 / gene_product=hypothetical protein / transcript_product=hypothetical protein / location=Cvel_scaffold5612:1607-2587(-) / protein_length=327 / sequence_SO=supercontig / SO=protein_coding / is_pseudo=false
MGPPPKLANPPRECDDDGMTAQLYQFMVDWRAGKYRGLWVADVHRQDNGEAIVTHTANRFNFRPTPPPAGGGFGKTGICRGSERESKHVSRLDKESLEGTGRRRLPFSHVGDDQTGTGWGGGPLQQQQQVHKAGGTTETAQSPQAMAGHSAQNYDGGGSAQHFELMRADRRVSIENGGGFSSLPEDEKMEGGGEGATAMAAPAPGVLLVRGKGGSPSSCSRINPSVTVTPSSPSLPPSSLLCRCDQCLRRQELGDKNLRETEIPGEGPRPSELHACAPPLSCLYDERDSNPGLPPLCSLPPPPGFVPRWDGLPQASQAFVGLRKEDE